MALCELPIHTEPQSSHLYSGPKDACLWAGLLGLKHVKRKAQSVEKHSEKGGFAFVLMVIVVISGEISCIERILIFFSIGRLGPRTRVISFLVKPVHVNHLVKSCLIQQDSRLQGLIY